MLGIAAISEVPISALPAASAGPSYPTGTGAVLVRSYLPRSEEDSIKSKYRSVAGILVVVFDAGSVIVRSRLSNYVPDPSPRSRVKWPETVPAAPPVVTIYNTPVSVSRSLWTDIPAVRSRSADAGFAGAFVQGYDGLRFFFSGAVATEGAQADPNANLGNYRSSTEVMSLGFFGGMKSLTVQRVGEGNAPGGVGSYESDGAGNFRWTEPGASVPGDWKFVPDLSNRYLPGSDASKGIRVSRNGSTPNTGARSVKLLDFYNDALGFDNVSDAERTAGDSEYRAIYLKNYGLSAFALKIYLGALGTSRTVNGAGYAAAGAVTITIPSGTLKDWADSGYFENANTGEVIYYASRTETALSVPAGGRDIYGDVGGGAAGTSGDVLNPISGVRVGAEAPGGSGNIQTIANENTAPAAVTFKHGNSAVDADALSYTLNPGASLGLWIHRKIPAGAIAAARIENWIVVQATGGGQTFTYNLRGVCRMEDVSLARYEVYRGVDADPDFTAAPWQTFTSLPFTTPALSVGHTYKLVTRLRNKFNLLSQNINQTAFVIDGGGAAVNYPSAPTWSLQQGPNGEARFVATYDYTVDAAAVQGDAWVIWLTTTGVDPDPAIDPPYAVLAMDGTNAPAKADGMAKLDSYSSPNADGTTLKALVRVRRMTGLVDSQNSAIQTVLADAVGPVAPSTVGVFLGQAARQQ